MFYIAVNTDFLTFIEPLISLVKIFSFAPGQLNLSRAIFLYLYFSRGEKKYGIMEVCCMWICL